MTGRTRLAIAGFGLIGRKHAAVIAAHGGAELVAVADPSDAAASAAAQAKLRHYRALDDLLAREACDGVIVATPNRLHVPAALACIARGLPILIEKPVADSVAAAQPLVEAAARHGVPVLIGHHRRHNPRLRRLREVVRSGRLGRLTSVAAFFLIRKPDSYFEMEWRRQPGGGPILINLIHDIDSLRFICGEIAEVQALTGNAVRGFAVEDSAVLNLRFANGALGTATVSDATPAPWSWELTSGENPDYPCVDAPCYFLAGTKGALQVPSLDLFSYDGLPEGEGGWHAPLARERIPAPDADPLPIQLGHFLDVIAGRKQPEVLLQDGLATLAVIEAIGLAASRGTSVRPAFHLEQAA